MQPNDNLLERLRAELEAKALAETSLKADLKIATQNGDSGRIEALNRVIKTNRKTTITLERMLQNAQKNKAVQKRRPRGNTARFNRRFK